MNAQGPVRVCLIGCGGMARHHVRTMLQQADRTEIVVAHVVLREGAEWEGIETALKDLVRDRVSAHLVPRRVVRAESLPMTATGKVMRRALRGG